MTAISKHKIQATEHLPIPVDSSLQGLALLLNPASVMQMLNDDLKSNELPYSFCEIMYVRYKPGTNCTVAYRVGKGDALDADAPHEILNGKCYKIADFAVAKEKSTAAGSNYRVISDDSTGCIFRDCTVDLVLEGMETIADRRKLRRILYDLIPSCAKSEWRISHKRMSSHVIRYKPEKRAVIKLHVPLTNIRTDKEKELVLYVRLYANGQGKTICQRMLSLNNSLPVDAPVVFPAPVFYDDHTRLLFTTEVAGEVIGDCLTPEKSGEAAWHAAKVLAAFHGLSNADIEPRSRAARMADVFATAETIRVIAPDLSGQIEHLISRLSRLKMELSSPAAGLVHGDYHPGQILVGGGRDALLDFDRTYIGDQADDLGNYIANLHLQQLQNDSGDDDKSIADFVSSYKEHVNKQIDESSIKFWTGCGLVQLAVSPFRLFEENWPDKISRILNRCREVIE